jgi:Mrp family chromosome partitioning ATPase
LAAGRHPVIRSFRASAMRRGEIIEAAQKRSERFNLDSILIHTASGDGLAHWAILGSAHGGSVVSGVRSRVTPAEVSADKVFRLSRPEP